MSETRDLLGAPVDFGGGVRLDAPELRGRVTLHEPALDAERTRGLSAPVLDEPLARAGFSDLVTLELTAEPVLVVRGEGLRGPSGEEAMLLEVPDLGGERGQVVLAVDEAGVASWSFAVDEGGVPEPPTVRGAGGVKRFLVRSHTPAVADAGSGATRGLLGIVGRKLVRVLVYPLTDPVLGRVGNQLAGVWEEHSRPYGVRRFDPDGYTLPPAGPLTTADWERLAKGRALLFIHGTFSTSHGAFGALPADDFAALHARYGGRVFAFDHFTLSHAPERNARWLLDQVPEGVKLEVDVVCHSRGGLVARMLAERADWLGVVDSDRLRVARAVFVGVPNRGTLLADPGHMVDFLDRVSTALNLFPLHGAGEILDSLLVVVKMVGHGALRGLAGLAAMDPHGAFITGLNQGGDGGGEYFGIAADFEPRGALRDFLRTVADAAVDRVFDRAANDLVVPTGGVYEANGQARFPLAAERVLTIAPGAGVIHTHYFSHPATAAALRAWLT